MKQNESNKNESNKSESTPIEQPQVLKIERVENKSEMIRRMYFNEGKTVKEIHHLTSIRYQMCRNIVEKEKLQRELTELRQKNNK